MNDLISRQAAIDALHMHLMYRMGTDSNKKRLDDWINSLPPAQGKPFNLPEIYIADGYDTIEGEDENVGFGVYVPDENQIYVAGDVEGEIRARALLHEICHWVQAMCGRPFDEDEANEFSDIIYDALPSAQPYTEAEIQKIQELEQAELEKAFELGKAEANKWIPCDKGEPDEGTECWVTVKTTDALYRGNFTKRYGERRDKGFVTSDGFMWWNTALAWMPIYEPEPYNAESEDKE